MFYSLHQIKYLKVYLKQKWPFWIALCNSWILAQGNFQRLLNNRLNLKTIGGVNSRLINVLLSMLGYFNEDYRHPRSNCFGEVGKNQKKQIILIPK